MVELERVAVPVGLVSAVIVSALFFNIFTIIRAVGCSKNRMGGKNKGLLRANVLLLFRSKYRQSYTFFSHVSSLLRIVF